MHVLITPLEFYLAITALYFFIGGVVMGIAGAAYMKLFPSFLAGVLWPFTIILALYVNYLDNRR